ncbi:hypothetical protein M1558_01295 [Candidatus Parvarchaeota archaeon]|nr:hypothetical protein [Candidatus Parvarchaeota archaeon]
MGVSLDGPVYYTISKEEGLEYEKELKNAQHSIDNTIKKTNEKGLKGMDALLSVLSDLSKSNAPIIAGEEYVRGEMKNLDYKLKDVESAANNEKIYEDLNGTSALGVSISAAINNVIKPGEKVHIKSIKPVDNLFYNLRNAEGHVNVAGDYLGKNAVNSKIYTRKAGNHVGNKIVNSELHVYNAGNSLAEETTGSKVYVLEAGDLLGDGSKGSIIFAKKAGRGAGIEIKNSKLYVDKAEDGFAHYARGSEIHFNEVGDNAANDIAKCNVYGRKAGKEFGSEAGGSKMYVDEIGDDSCSSMAYSELHFKKINGKLGRSYNYFDYFDLQGTDIPLVGKAHPSKNKVYKNRLLYLPYELTKGLISLWRVYYNYRCPFD